MSLEEVVITQRDRELFKAFGDFNMDGIIDIFDAAFLSGEMAKYKAGEPWNRDADLNKDGVVDILDAAVLNRYWHMTIEEWVASRPKPPLDVWILRIVLLKLPWWNAESLASLADNLIISPAQAAVSLLGYTYLGSSITDMNGVVEIDLNFVKTGTPAVQIPAIVWAAIAIVGVLAIGYLVSQINWNYQLRIEEQKLVTIRETTDRLTKLLEEGKITPEQYAELTGKLQDWQEQTGGDMWGTLTQWLPWIILLGAGAYILGMLPRRRD